jgi:multidrug efflux pump subunit AcrB
VDKAVLPSEAEDPVVESIATDTDSVFNLLIYANEDAVNYERLIEIAKQIEFDLESRPIIDEITIDASDTYDVRVILDQQKIEQL